MIFINFFFFGFLGLILLKLYIILTYNTDEIKHREVDSTVKED